MADQSTFRALVLREDSGKISAAIETRDNSELPDGDVTVAVRYSTLNYKDGMVLGGIGRLVRDYPHVPGIDFAGVVEESGSDRYKPGDQVILTGWRVGEARWGGYAQKARVKADWLVPLPDGLTDKQAMALGTAGFTAMLAVMDLPDHGIEPDSGPVLVTGGNGGVGGVAIAILAAAGYEVHASTGRPKLADHLKSIGAAEIIARDELDVEPERPLATERWAGVVDAVAGNTLASVLPQMKYHGAVAACGLAGGAQLKTTVVPFLLRGVNLLGIDSVMRPFEDRVTAWRRIASDLPMEQLEAMVQPATLSDLPALGAAILKGQIRGRVVVDVNS